MQGLELSLIHISEKGRSEHIKTYADRLQCHPMYEERRWGEYKVIDTRSFHVTGVQTCALPILHTGQVQSELDGVAGILKVGVTRKFGTQKMCIRDRCSCLWLFTYDFFILNSYTLT